MRRWLVALALAVVVVPDASASDMRVDLATRKVTTSTHAPYPTCLPRPGGLPANVDVSFDRIAIKVGAKQVKHPIGELSWVVASGKRILVGHAVHTGGIADSILAIDHTTGAVGWKRRMDSMFAAELVGDLIAIERAGTLDILDVRTGKTVGTTAITGQGIQAICRTTRGDILLKTGMDLISIDRGSGHVRWVQPTTARGNSALTATAVVDGWVDRTTHRFGIVTYDPATGKKLESIDLGPTGGWYDYERVELAPDGGGEVVVSSMFGVE